MYSRTTQSLTARGLHRAHIRSGNVHRCMSTLTPQSILQSLNLTDHTTGIHYNNTWHTGTSSHTITSTNPSTGETIAKIKAATPEQVNTVLNDIQSHKHTWSDMPMPIRGEIVRQIGQSLRQHKQALGMLVSLEMGKIQSEGLGEIQECIDICDYAVGLSRMIGGTVIPSERPHHTILERYNPLYNSVAVITAFNFPTAVYFWNIAISLVCGNTNVWKPSETTSLTAIACTNIVADVLQANDMNSSIVSLVCGNAETGKALVQSPHVDLVSFTGSTKIGRDISVACAQTFKRRILELGGNNCMVVMDDANVDMALRAAVFGAVGTAGQRCTSLRRLMLHSSVYDKFVPTMIKAYKSIKIGDVISDASVLCGPLHSQAAVKAYEKGIADAVKQGGKVLCGGKRLDRPGNFVEPTIIEMTDAHAPCMQHEVFAPIVYVLRINSLQEAIELNNGVPQGLSSSVFTESQKNVWKWTGAHGSDCGIVNVNMGPSGAEIGGAFGGNKETGGGRESGSDAWKQYMRQSTCSINYADTLPLAQGVKFDI